MNKIVWKLAATVAVAGSLLAVGTTQANADEIYTLKTKVTSVGANYTTYGGWTDCTKVSKSSVARSVGCTKTTSIASGVTGNIGVSDGVMSANVGFSVTATTSIAASESFNVPKNQTGYIQFRAVYLSRDVHWAQYRCTAQGACLSTGVKGTETGRHYHAADFRYDAS
jgi:hypothetical protein